MIKKSAIIITALLLIVVYFSIDPSGSAVFPKCPFLMLTGLKCPGCGSQRAIHSLLHLDFVHAFQYNALLVLSIPAVILYLYSEATRKKKPELYSTLHKTTVIWCILAAVILWWILRNVLNL